MSVNYRCTRSSCRKRITLKRRKELYVREPTCAVCGGNLSYDPEPKRRATLQVCHCDGLPFPHRSGTRFCIHSDGPESEEDFRDMLRHMTRSYT